MRCGVRFCGGCNPKYNRGQTLQQIKEAKPDLFFQHAVEGETYDLLLVFGGCSSCCASYDRFEVDGDVLKVWDPSHVQGVLEEIKKMELISKS